MYDYLGITKLLLLYCIVAKQKYSEKFTSRINIDYVSVKHCIIFFSKYIFIVHFKWLINNIIKQKNRPYTQIFFWYTKYLQIIYDIEIVEIDHKISNHKIAHSKKYKPEIKNDAKKRNPSQTLELVNCCDMKLK